MSDVDRVDNSIYLFGEFRFIPSRQLLLGRDAPIRLGGRGMDLLHALLQRPGDLVSKEELNRAVWPNTMVHEDNLKVNIAALRRALKSEGAEDSCIATVAGRGYRFTAAVTMTGPPAAATAKIRYRVPRIAMRPIGRDDVKSGICELLAKNRLVTILGHGGIGKTTVALMVANELVDTYADGICFVDLGRVADESKVYAAIGAELDFIAGMEPSVEQLLNALHGRRLLLILDSCEHVADYIARLTEELLVETGDIDVLVTSRESLRIKGEFLWRLAPLDTPPPVLSTSAASIELYSSVRLFERTVRQTMAGFTIDDGNAGSIAEICRHLDGIPLAIELAASTVDVLGIKEVERSLGESFSLLNIDRRAVVPRQRSMAATIDWSYNLLPQRAQAVLNSLSCFAGSFTLEAAIAVAGNDDLDAGAVRDAVVTLARKSLVNLSDRAGQTEYRLLETTRAYASQAPCPPGERGLAKGRHACYFLRLLEQMDWDAYDPVTDREKLWRWQDEIQAALDWAFAADVRLAAELTLAAENLWAELSGLAQRLHYLGLASTYVASAENTDALLRARVLVAFAFVQSAVMTRGMDDSLLYEKACQSARETRDELLQVRALYAIVLFLWRVGQPVTHFIDEMFSIAGRSDDVAIQQLPLMLSAYDDTSNSDIIAGIQKFERIVATCPSVPRRHSLQFSHDFVISSEVTLALMKYWMGYCVQARSTLASLVKRAELSANPMTLCWVLAHGAIWCELRSGDIRQARFYLKKLEEIGRLYKPWQTLVISYRAALIGLEYRMGRASRNEVDEAVAAFGEALENDFLKRQGKILPALLFELADMRILLGDFDAAMKALEEASSHKRNEQDARVIAVHDRLLAQLCVARNQPGDQEAARSLFQRAIETAHIRSAYLIEFEATIGLAELDLETGHPARAKQLVAELLGRAEDREGIPGWERAHEILKLPSS